MLYPPPIRLPAVFVEFIVLVVGATLPPSRDVAILCGCACNCDCCCCCCCCCVEDDDDDVAAEEEVEEEELCDDKCV